MFERVRKHINPATILALVALVFAVTGGAFAANSHSGGSGSKATGGGLGASKQTIATTAKSKAKPKTKAGPRGPAGPKGATGTTGPAGPAGATGPGGPQGPAGGVGPQGPAGVTGATGATGEKGETGKEGPKGKEGREGALGTAGTTLPKDASETGVWGFGPQKTKLGSITEALVSFPIPLASGVTVTPHFINSAGEELHYEAASTAPTGCGSPVGNALEPTAEPGNLCMYEQSLAHTEGFSEGINQDGEVGALVLFLVNEVGPENEVSGHGTWAVTAP